MTETRGQRWHREAERHLVRDGVALGLALTMGWGALTAVGCAAADASREARETQHVSQVLELGTRVSDRIMVVEDAAAQEEPAPEEAQPQEEEVQEEYYEPDEFIYYDGAYYNTSTFDVSAYPTDGLTPQSGVNAYDGRVETYYSSNVLHHYRTDEWTVDSEGFYRTDEGYYVVAASDMEQGTIFEGSKGECIVLDSGCAEGVTDYYVAW